MSTNAKGKNYLRISGDNSAARLFPRSEGSKDRFMKTSDPLTHEGSQVKTQEELSQRVYEKFSLKANKNFSEASFPAINSDHGKMTSPTQTNLLNTFSLNGPSLSNLKIKPKNKENTSKTFMSGLITKKSERSAIPKEAASQRIRELDGQLREMKLKYAKMVAIASQLSGKGISHLEMQELPLEPERAGKAEDSKFLQLTHRMRQLNEEQQETLHSNKELIKGRFVIHARK